MSYWLQSRESVSTRRLLLFAQQAQRQGQSRIPQRPQDLLLPALSTAHRPKKLPAGAHFPALGPFLKRSQAVVCHLRIPVGYVLNSPSGLATPWPCHIFVMWPHRPCLSGLELFFSCSDDCCRGFSADLSGAGCRHHACSRRGERSLSKLSGPLRSRTRLVTIAPHHVPNPSLWRHLQTDCHRNFYIRLGIHYTQIQLPVNKPATSQPTTTQVSSLLVFGNLEG